ncbi:hypothetical protein RHGRI_017888 [Rhododendron griersonianum]|uniref:EXPERA domain-containing protein n=1 Tax=Rhododendron griersonianum TaxID=479676 RepID=A0AAV6JZI8_9ERIC|nr:hypothetical protein RHGRI_017888 [Rhododendron griersonianum]
MGVFLNLIDALLFFFFTIIAICAPLIDSQACLPAHLYPKVIVDLTTWYSHEFGDYLMVEKPNFFVGLVWLELLFAWPLSLLNLYAILRGRSWFRTTCLVYGVSTFTSMVAILSEMLGSQRASDKLLMMHYPFLGFAVLAILRGLLPYSGKTTAAGTRPGLTKKKRV